MIEKKCLEVNMAGLSPILCEVIAAGGNVELTVTGNSMYPMLRHRVSRVKLSAADGLKVGDVPLYIRNNGAYVLHRIIKAENGIYSMCGDNQWVLEKGIRRDQVIAVMTAFSRDGKKWTDCDNALYIMYRRVWLAVRLVRRLWHGGINRLRRLLKWH